MPYHMSYGIDTHNLPQIDSYARALVLWNDSKPWRGYGEDDPRPLGNSQTMRRKRHMSVHLKNDRSVAFRLYRTDVVIYHLDRSITINTYGSKSTQDFCDALTPDRVRVRMTGRSAPLVSLATKKGSVGNWRCNRISDSVRVVPTEDGVWQIAPTCVTYPFIKPTINKERSKIATRESGLSEFIVWRNAYLAMNPGAESHRRLYLYQRTDLLEKRDLWSSIAATPGIVDFLRKQVYKMFKVYDFVELRDVESHEVWRKIEPAMRRANI